MMKNIILDTEERACRLREEILNAPDLFDIAGTVYYVSTDGDDSLDGLSPENAWKTPEKVSLAILAEGDGVLFRRGDVFRGSVRTQSGVSYGAYGEGEKPRFFGWDYDLAAPGLWEPFDSELGIWKLKNKIPDVGVLVFDGGRAHSRKLIPSYINGVFVCRDDESRLFDIRTEMLRDLDIYWHFEDRLTENPSKGESFPIPVVDAASFGDLYLRCEGGNPGEVFSSIEAAVKRVGFAVGANRNVRIDNICLKYYGHHAVSAGGHSVGLQVTNCEIGWIGGTIQHYFGTDPNYPEGRRGTVTRFGNGVEIYGGCEDYLVSRCYIYQVYDAAITHQVTTRGRKFDMKNIAYRSNLVENCVYSIEYFLDMTEGDCESLMDGVEISGNILRLSGYGWGQQRHNADTPAHIKGWSYVNRARNFRIFDNIFDRAMYKMLHVVSLEPESLPEMRDNTYIQYRSGNIGRVGYNRDGEPNDVKADGNVADNIERIFGERGARVCIIGKNG